MLSLLGTSMAKRLVGSADDPVRLDLTRIDHVALGVDEADGTLEPQRPGQLQTVLGPEDRSTRGSVPEPARPDTHRAGEDPEFLSALQVFERRGNGLGGPGARKCEPRDDGRGRDPVER